MPVFQPVPATSPPSKSRKMTRVALGRLCSLNVWVVAYAGVAGVPAIAALPPSVAPGAMSREGSSSGSEGGSMPAIDPSSAAGIASR